MEALHKDEIISKDASWIFRIAPYIVFAVTIVVGTSIPIFVSFPANILTGDLLVVVYTLAIGTFFMALAGMDTGSSFGGFGSSREMTISALAEGGLIFSLLTVSLVSKTTNLFAISRCRIYLKSVILFRLSCLHLADFLLCAGRNMPAFLLIIRPLI